MSSFFWVFKCICIVFGVIFPRFENEVLRVVWGFLRDRVPVFRKAVDVLRDLRHYRKLQVQFMCGTGGIGRRARFRF